MRFSGAWVAGWLSLAVLLVSGCVQPLPRDMSFQQLLDRDHPVARIQQRQADKVLQDMHTQGVFFEHVQLRALTDHILQRLFPEDVREQLSIRFARMPGENAFALPIGDIVFHLSLLAALENEEQYAFVLAHEAVHVLDNHSLRGANNRRGKRVAAHVTDLLTLGSGRAYRHFAQSIQKFSREQEYIADKRALEILRAAGYNLSRGVGFFDLLDQYPLAINTADGLNSHPSNRERRQRLDELMSAKDIALSTQTGRAGFKRMRRSLLKRSIEDKIEEQDFPAALVQIAALEGLEEEKHVTECLRGDVFLALSHNERQSRNALREVASSSSARFRNLLPEGARDPAVSNQTAAVATGFFASQAKLAFIGVTKHMPKAPCAMRGLGLLHHAAGQPDAGDYYLKEYLKSNPSGAFGRHAAWLVREKNHRAAAGSVNALQ